jgi:hydrogenase expression/formation protein HypC
MKGKGFAHMCLAIPGKILSTEQVGESRLGRVQFGGITRETQLDLVPEAQLGDYVVVHAGFAISRLDEEEAQRTLALLEQMGALAEELPAEESTPPAAN